MRRFLLLAGTAVVSACGAGGTTGTVVERSDSAGVAVVRSRGADVPLSLEFTPTVSLGGEDDGPESFFRIGQNSVAVDEAGTLYVLDTGNLRVVVFDSAGRHLRTLGREGGGPGEFQLWPQRIRIGPDGSINVYDFGKHGLVRFTAEGEVLPSRILDTYLPQGEYAFIDVGLVVRTEVASDDWTRSDDVLAVVEEDGDTTVLASFARAPGRQLDFGCVRLSGMPPLFSPELVWTGDGSSVLVSAGVEYRIDLYEGGRRSASFRRDLPARSATRALALQQVGDEMEVTFSDGGSCVVQPDEVVEKRGYAAVLPSIGALARAPDGTIWVRRFAVRGEDAAIDLLSPDGAYIGTLPPGSPFPAAFMPDGRIVAVERDELDIPRVVLYRLEGYGDVVAGSRAGKQAGA